MNCPIVFKKATLEDEGEYLRLSKLFYATDAVLSPLPEEFHKNIFKEICRSSAYLEAFLFSFAGEIAGYGLVSKRFSTEAGGLECWVEDLLVLPKFRGKGIGGAFLDFVKKRYSTNRFRLEVEEENHRAVALYRKHGFEFLSYRQMICDAGN